jgi:hypothetical protein
MIKREELYCYWMSDIGNLKKIRKQMINFKLIGMKLGEGLKHLLRETAKLPEFVFLGRDP